MIPTSDTSRDTRNAVIRRLPFRPLLCGTIAAALVFAPACSSLRTMDARDGVTDIKARVGLHYFLPRGVIQVKGMDVSGTYTIEITRSNVPDTSARYLLRQTTSPFHDDTSKFKVNDAGLLVETIDSSGDPKIDEIIAKLLETAVNIGKIKTQLANTPGGPVGDTPPAKAYRPFNVSFDPFDYAEVKHARTAIERAGFTMDLMLPTGERDHTRLDRRGRPYVAPDQTHDHPGQSSAGVLYRPPTSVKISLRGIDMVNNNPLIVTRSVAVPDPTRTATYSMRRGVFTKRSQKVVMVAGEPTEVDFSHPSELLGLVTIPATVTGTVLENIGPLSKLFYRPSAKNKVPEAAQAAKEATEAEGTPGSAVATEQDSSAASKGFRTSVPHKTSTPATLNVGPGQPARGPGHPAANPLNTTPEPKLPQDSGPPTTPPATGPGTPVRP